MAVKVGNSWVSEAALSYAKVKADSGESATLNGLLDRYPGVNFSTNTQAFSQKGTNNIQIAPIILAQYFKEQGVPFVFRCINRLDRDTSGLTIVAKHAVSAAILGQMVRAKAEQGLKAPGIHRTYLALVEGKVVPVSGVIDAPIARQEDRCLRRVVDFKRGDRAVTHYRVLTGWQTGNAQKFRSLVKLQLETGRTHQIRVHMAYLGHPLVGDFLYNPAYGENQIDRRDDENSGERQIFQGKTFSCGKEQYDIGRQALHAWKLSFPHPMTGQPMNFTAPLPPDMQRLIPEEALPSV